MLHNLQSTLKDIKKAMRLVDDEDYEEALPLLAKIVAFAPPSVSAPAYHLWAICHLRLERMERALQIAEEGVAKGILPGKLQMVRAEALMALERYEEAAAAADAAHELDPDDPDPIRIRAVTEIERGELESALRILDDARPRFPDDADLHWAYVDVADHLERSPLVIDGARAYLRKFERDPDILAALGRAYMRTNDFRRAERAFYDAVDLDFENVENHMNILALAFTRKDDEAYDAYLEELRETDPEIAEQAARGMGAVLAKVDERQNPGGSGRRGHRRRPGER